MAAASICGPLLVLDSVLHLIEFAGSEKLTNSCSCTSKHNNWHCKRIERFHIEYLEVCDNINQITAIKQDSSIADGKKSSCDVEKKYNKGARCEGTFIEETFH